MNTAMSNMSYCRFQNTVQDLQDCYDNIDDSDLSAAPSAALCYVIGHSACAVTMTFTS